MTEAAHWKQLQGSNGNAAAQVATVHEPHPPPLLPRSVVLLLEYLSLVLEYLSLVPEYLSLVLEYLRCSSRRSLRGLYVRS